MKVHLDRVFETIRTPKVQKRDYFAATTLESLENYATEFSDDDRQAKTLKDHAGS